MKRLITGGARSGKSSFAESLYQNDNVTYIATSIYDEDDYEMIDRIKKHQLQRNSLWKTVEVDYYLDIKADYILLDCLALFTSNVLYSYTKDLDLIDSKIFDQILNHLKNEITKLIDNNKDIIFVTNEVGLGLVPINHLERVYRDLLGKVNIYVASKVDEVYLVTCGIPLKIKGEN